MIKRDCQIKHAKRRFLERIGKILTNEDYKILVKLIKNNATQSIKKVSNRISIHKIKYKEEILYAVYDKNRHTIVTFLQYEDSEVEEIKRSNQRIDVFRTKNLEIQEDFEKFNLKFLEEMEEREKVK